MQLYKVTDTDGRAYHGGSGNLTDRLFDYLEGRA